MTRRGTGRILRALSFGLVLAAGGATSVAETSLTLFSDPGDPIGRGAEYAFAEPDGTFTVTTNAWNGVSIWMRAQPGPSDWTLDFAGIDHQLLTVGTYTDVIHYPPLDPARPSLQITGNYTSCSIVAGRFEVIDVAYGVGGGIDRFRARFEQYCQSSTHPLTGEIRFQTIVPIHLTVPRTESVLEGSELRFTVSGVPDDGGPVALSAQGLPAGASFTSTGPRSGELRWTPGALQAGSYIVTFLGEDSSGHIEDASTRILVGDVLHVPSDHARIQTAIDVATQGSLVIVGPGTYRENLDMRGKALTLRSEEGPLATIIDGQRHGSVILVNAPGPGAGVEGFTIQNGLSNGGAGLFAGGSPRVVGNIFLGNEQLVGGSGAAIAAYGGTPFIDRNVFRDNRCDGQWSAGVVSLGGDASPLVANNLFEHNPCAAINLRVASASAVSIVNNTMVDNRVGVRLEGLLSSAQHTFGNNVIVGNEVGLQVDHERPGEAPIWTHNLLSGNDVNYLDTSDRTGVDGNIDAAPSFLCPARSDYRPTASSPAVDSGDSTIALPGLDLRGTARTLDGDGDGTAVVDLGAWEYDPSSPGICLVCPADSTVLAPHGQVTAVVDYPAPSLSEGATVECDPPSGAVFSEGATTVTCVAHDTTLDTETCSFRITIIVPPANDDFDFATEISTLPFLDRVDTRKATVADDDPVCGSNASVWYTYLPLRDTLIDFQTSGSSYVPVIAVYTGERGSLTLADDACSTGHESVAVRAGLRIYIKVTPHHTPPSGGDLVVSVSGILCTSRPQDCGPPRLVRPSSRGVLASGSITDIVWKAPTTSVRFDLRYTIDGGTSWKPIASGLTEKSFAWTVPVPSANKPQSKVRVVGYNTAGSKAGTDETDLPFTIEVVKLDEPDGHEDLISGNMTLIHWTIHATMSPVTGVKLQFSTNGGTSWKTVASLSGNPGAYAWMVPAVKRENPHCKVRVVLEDAGGRSLGKDASDAAFTIYPGEGRP